MNIARFLARSAAQLPQRPAVSRGPATVATYRELAQRAAALAHTLRTRLHLTAGDRVALMMSNSVAYTEILYGAWWGGLAAVPVNAKLHPSEAAYILEHAGAKVCFVTPDLAESIGMLAGKGDLAHVIDVESAEYAKLFREASNSAPLPAQGDDLAWLFYTSGTTGRPKGVMITHRNLQTMSLCYFADVDTIASTDCILHAAPMSHGSGLYSVPHVLQGANQIIPESGHFDPSEIFALCRRWQGVAFFAAPTMVRRLTLWAEQNAPDPTGLKTIIYGGGPMYVEDLKQALQLLGERFVQIYGQGECPMTITALSRAHIGDRAHPRWEARLGSVGIAQSAVEVRVAGEDDRPLDSGEVGEILVRGDAVMRGYWRNEEASRETLRNGWLHTGDVGSLDEEGFLTLRDRSKDLIISGGSNIYPREVEEVLMRHPDVVEASVVGRPHVDWGEEVVAFVVCRANVRVEPAELERLCLDHIARFKRPKEYRFVEALPKNNYGKVLKTELRKLLENNAS